MIDAAALETLPVLPTQHRRNDPFCQAQVANANAIALDLEDLGVVTAGGLIRF